MDHGSAATACHSSSLVVEFAAEPLLDRGSRSTEAVPSYRNLVTPASGGR